MDKKHFAAGGKAMKRLASAVIPALLALILAGCGDHDHERVVVNLRVVEIFSDPTLDGDITADLATGAVGVPTIAAKTGNVLAGKMSVRSQARLSPKLGPFSSSRWGRSPQMLPFNSRPLPFPDTIR